METLNEPIIQRCPKANSREVHECHDVGLDFQDISRQYHSMLPHIINTPPSQIAEMTLNARKQRKIQSSKNLCVCAFSIAGGDVILDTVQFPHAMSHCVQPLLRLHPWSRLQTIWPNLKVHSLILTPHVRTDTCLILPKTPSVTPATAYACHLMLVTSCYFKDFDVSWWFSCESTLTNVVNFLSKQLSRKPSPSAAGACGAL